MTILGKLLIVFNLLAAGAFAYFTLENWKVRKDLTRMAAIRDIQLNGLPVEFPPVAPDDLDSESTPFGREINGYPYEQLPKKTFDGALPNGDEVLGWSGGEERVYHQTAEVKRVQAKVFAHIQGQAGQDQNLRFQWLRAYNLAVARTGAERDGVAAVFDLRDPTRSWAARRDLPLALRTESQVAALRALVEVAELGVDPQQIPEAVRAARIASAREAIKRFALGEAEHGAAEGEPRRQLKNAVVAAFLEGAGEAQKNAIAQAATDKAYQVHVAAVAIEPLGDRPSLDRAAAALIAYAKSKVIATTKAEEAAIDAIATLIRPPVQGWDMAAFNSTIDAAGTQLLTAKFEAAALPAGSRTDVNGNPAGEKARRIAHLLYHIDGWRYATPQLAAARKAGHERVAAIVGLPAYIRAAEAEATEYAEAAQRLVAAITEEQSAFEAEYQAQLQRILFLYNQWLALDAQLKTQTAITAENERLMNERKTERDNLLEELRKARADAKTALTKLKGTQESLFAIQKDLRDAQEALLVLEKELRRLELRDDIAGKR